MIRALRRRLDGDRGSALLFVIVLSVVALLLVGTATTALVQQIRPDRQAQDQDAALAAAQAGVEDFVANLNAQCQQTDGFACAWLTVGRSSGSATLNPATTRGTPVAAPAGSTASAESFWWTVTNTVPGVARVQSVGQVPMGGTSRAYRTSTLIADVYASPSFTNFQYYTKYETYSQDFVDNFYRPRQIQLTSQADYTNTALAGKSKPAELTWTGVCSTATTTGCDPTHSSDICDDFYYASPTGPGRGTDTAWSNSSGRRPTSAEAGLGTDNSFAYYSEGGSFQPDGSQTKTAVTHNDTCDSSFEPNTVLNGPVYSQDAYLVDRGKDTGNSKGSQPQLNDYAYSLWDGTENGSKTALGPSGGYARAYPGTDGSVSTTKSPFPVYTTNKLDLPANAASAKALASCVYTGPTRIRLVQSVAYVTSPLTPQGAGACYTSTGTVSASTGGVTHAQVPVGSTLIYVQNPATSATPVMATATNPVFSLSTATLTEPTVTISGTVASTLPSAGYSPTAPCPPAGQPLSRRQVDCELNPGNPNPPDSAAALQANVSVTLGQGYTVAATLQSALQLSLQNLLGSVLSSIFGGYSYTLTVNLPTLTTSQVSAPQVSPGDAFYRAQTTGGYSVTTLATSISLVRRCVNVLICHDPPTTVIAGSVSSSVYSGTPVTTTQTFPWQGAPATNTSTQNDIGQYPTNEGDAYVEGTLKGSLSIVAEHDIVATNDITYANTNLATTSDGLALVADHDVRVYRPMTCAHAGTSGRTTAGYCPDDLTGVYTQPASWPLPSNFPSAMYTLSAAPSMSTTGQGLLYGSIFALRGSFSIDNFYRGPVGQGLSLYGGLYQYHRGATSLPYQGRPFQGSQNKMPGLTLSYNYDDMRAGQSLNGGLRVPWVPTPGGNLSTRTWSVGGLSTVN